MTRPIFSLAEARALLPQVKMLTADAVIRADAVTAELQQMSEADPAHAEAWRYHRRPIAAGGC